MYVDQIDELYKDYGFIKKKSTKEAEVFAYSIGVFNNIEIVKLEEDYDCTDIIKEYQDIGYACKAVYYHNIDEAHERLFKGFFNFDITNRRLNSEYSKFCESQTKYLTYKYNYIDCPYYFNSIEQSDNLIQEILGIINSEGPHLVILEAAAGYGKTCTSYELLKGIVNQSNNNKIPIFTELSRNRKAAMFKYVLYDEMDKYFHSLKSGLVINEITKGRLPLIIDGFDELINKVNETGSSAGTVKDKDHFDEAESMLDTIGDLLVGNAKVILTSRKSAMFTGEKFNYWVSNRDNKFKITRFILGEPSLKHWLGTGRVEALKEKNIPINKLANPVLLAFLKNLSDKEFYEYTSDIEKVINKYFNSLLEREKGRQNVVFTVEEQMNIYKSLALQMVELNITTESREFIKDIIFEKQKDLIDSVRQRYAPTDRPDSDNIAYTLSRHVLLDRVGMGESNKIGFVNDFIFGILIGEGICDYNGEWIGDTEYIDLACTAFSIRSEDKRKMLYNKIKPSYELLYPQEQIEVDMKLMYCLMKGFSQASFYSLTFNDFNFTDGYGLNECTFTQCRFKKIKLKRSSFYKCTFYDCVFYDCEFIKDVEDDRHITFLYCTGQATDEFAPSIDIGSQEHEQYFEVCVLQQFWPKGRANAQPTREYRTLFAGFPVNQHSQIQEAIERLRRKGILEKDGELVNLKYEYMSDIRGILGRNEGE